MAGSFRLAGFVSVLAVVAFVACGGSSSRGSSPSAPPGPPTTVSGRWVGVDTLVRATPASHCIARRMNELQGGTRQLSVVLTQSGSSVSGSFNFAGVVLPFSGTLQGGRLQGAFPAAARFVDVCGSGEPFALQEVANLLDGRFDQGLGRFEGVLDRRFNVFEFMGLRQIEVRHRIEFTRE